MHLLQHLASIPSFSNQKANNPVSKASAKWFTNLNFSEEQDHKPTKTSYIFKKTA